MGGELMDLMMHTLSCLVDQLGDTDRLCIIGISDIAERKCPLHMKIFNFAPPLSMFLPASLASLQPLWHLPLTPTRTTTPPPQLAKSKLDKPFQAASTIPRKRSAQAQLHTEEMT
jgi:hypothetical protein